MWKKPLSISDIEALATGELVIKYPISGAPANEIDLSSEEKFVLYEVSRVDHQQLVLRIPELDRNGQHHFGGQELPVFDEYISLSKQDLLSQSVWWCKE